MAYLASSLASEFDLKYEIVNGVRIKPYLTLRHDRFDATFHTIAEAEFCKGSKLAPDRNNMHFDWWSQRDDDGQQRAEATPIYNALIHDDLVSAADEAAKIDQLFEQRIPNLGAGSRVFALWLRRGSCTREFLFFSVFQKMST